MTINHIELAYKTNYFVRGDNCTIVDNSYMIDFLDAYHEAKLAEFKPKETPSSKWDQEGNPDPHGNDYDCERAKLTLGDYTDDELANAVFMHGATTAPIVDIITGKAKMPIVYLTAAKDRIRWLSRNVNSLLTKNDLAVKALKYWRNECSGNEPSLSVFNIMVDEVLKDEN